MDDEINSPTLQTDKGLMSETEFRIGYDNQEDPKIMVFNVPLQMCADNLEYGSALIRGKLDEAKQIALNIVKVKRERKQAMTGLARPNGFKPNLKVN